MNGRLSLTIVLLLSLGGAASGSRAADNPLQPFRQLTLPGGIASAATCISFANPADGGPTGGVLSLDTLPPGATVQEAWLYWTVLSYTTPVASGAPTLDGTDLQPEFLGEQLASPCFAQFYTAAWRADVTGLVTANGDYQLAGLLGEADISATDFTEGATLLATYCAPGRSEHAIVILDGLDVVNAMSPVFRQDIDGFTATAGADVGAVLVVAAGNGQSRVQPEDPGVDPFLFNEVDLDQSRPEILSGALCAGLYYDHTRLDVSSLVPSGSTSATLEIRQAGDCYTIAAVALEVEAVPGLALREPSALDRDPLAPPLLVSRSPLGLELVWEDLGGGSIYHAYRGRIGDWYDHGDIGACDLLTPALTLADEPGDHYFLAVTEGCGGAESTPGRDSLGAGRPSAADASGMACP